MKLLCSLAVALFCLSANALLSDDAATLLTFDQLHYLTPDARVQYFQQIRSALAELEHSVNANEDDKSALENLRHYFDQIAAELNPLESALAESSTCPPPFKAIGPNKVCGRLPDPGETCSNMLTDTTGDTSVSYCRVTAKNLATKKVDEASPQERKPTAKVPMPPPRLDDGQVADVTPTAKEPATIKTKKIKALKPKLADDGQKCATRESARKAFYHDSPVHCLMGGNLSSYKSGHIQTGNCQHVTTFPSDKAANESGVISCPSGQNLCNPLLYCGAVKGKKFQPLCKKVSQNLTDDCEKGTREAEKGGKRCDPFNSPDLPGVHEEWNKFAKAVRGLCKRGTSFQAFFCNECEHVKARLASAKPAEDADHPIPPGLIPTAKPHSEGSEVQTEESYPVRGR